MTDTDSNLQIPEILPLEAIQILNSEKPAILLDVRSKVEFDYVGHPIGAINIPWQEPPLWSVVPGFVGQVRAALARLNGDAPLEELIILALCRSGARSMNASIELKKNGFANVINIAEGFEGSMDKNRQRGNVNGWRYHDLPWEQT
jgi:rhodanese-related sulfurtransferase